MNDPINLSDPSGMDPALNGGSIVTPNVGTPNNSDLSDGSAAAAGLLAAKLLQYFGMNTSGWAASSPNPAALNAARNMQMAITQVTGQFAHSSGPDLLAFHRGFFGAIGDGVKGTARLAFDPEASVYLNEHPFEAAKAMLTDLIDTDMAMMSGDMEAMGRGAGTLLPAVVGGEFGDLGTLGEEVEAAPRLGRLQSTGPSTWESTNGLIYGPDSNPLFENRVRHVLDHTVPNPSKTTHSVFNVPRNKVLGLLDEAWARRGAPVVGDPGAYVIPMQRQVGSVANQTAVRIVVIPGTSQVITAYPVVP